MEEVVDMNENELELEVLDEGREASVAVDPCCATGSPAKIK
jgi:hypothetical protein